MYVYICIYLYDELKIKTRISLVITQHIVAVGFGSYADISFNILYNRKEGYFR